MQSGAELDDFKWKYYLWVWLYKPVFEKSLADFTCNCPHEFFSLPWMG